MKLSIRGKLLVTYLLLIAATSTTLGVFFYLQERETVRAEMVKRGNDVIKTFTQLAVNHILLMDYITVLDNAEELVRAGDIRSIALTNVQGDVLVSTDGERRRLATDEAFLEEIIRSKQQRHREIDRAGWRGLEFVAPIVPLGETIYLIRMELSWVAAEQRQLEILRGSIVLSGAIVLVAIVVGIVLSRVLSEPVKKLVEGTQEIMRGNLDHRIQVHSGDEIGVLADSFNRMSDHLKSVMAHRDRVEEELRVYHDHLEVLVAERTAALQAAQAELIRKERLATLGQLTAVVSHELRNPLGTIRASLYLIAQRLDGKGLGIQAVLDRTDRNITRCDRIIQELLDYTRMGTLAPQPTRIDEWLGELLDEQTIPEGISLVRDLAAGLEIAIDRERMRRCMVNLINNANEAMTGNEAQIGGGAEAMRGRLTVSTRAKGERVEILVTDTGSGIAPDQRARIFEALFSTKSFGIGLGLPIVKEIVEKHGGGIRIESDEGKGTTVELWLEQMAG